MTNKISTYLKLNVAPRVTSELQPQLQNPMIATMLRTYLPQTWLFISETAKGTLFVGLDGVAKVFEGDYGTPDVSITWTDQAYFAAFVLQNRSAIPPQSPKEPSVQRITPKGGAAFDFLHERLNL
jgi:hypothetical protein